MGGGGGVGGEFTPSGGGLLRPVFSDNSRSALVTRVIASDLFRKFQHHCVFSFT